MKKTTLFFSILLIVQLACNIQNTDATPDAFATLDGLYTASALTKGAYTATPGIPQPQQMTSTPPASKFNCDAAEFVEDLNYPDGTQVNPNSAFVKSWRIKNIGTCAWTPEYTLVFVGGDSMDSPSSIRLGTTVQPNETTTLSISLVSPVIAGRFTGYWKLRNESGTLFGIGKDAESPFWAEIVVKGESNIVYEFAPNYCKAEWSNANESLPCPGVMGDHRGFIVKIENPILENGKKEDEPALLVFPQNTKQGMISGKYPSFTVKNGDLFRAIINCAEDAVDCDVFFKLDYKINGTTKTLASWQEVYEGEFYPVNHDLSPLAGETVEFILTVASTGTNNGDYALWLNPHILRQGNP